MAAPVHGVHGVPERAQAFPEEQWLLATKPTVREPEHHAALAPVDLTYAMKASVGQRLAANLVDSGLLLAGLFALLLVAWIFGQVSSTLGGLVSLLSYLLVFATIPYIIYFNGRGGTIGKRFVGVRVVDVDTGAPIGSSRSAVRYLVMALMGMPCYLGYLSPFFDKTGQLRGWHDMAAGDRVIEVSRMSFSEAVRP